MPSRILGLSAYYHDSAACLVEDGRIVAAAQEERFTRKKHDANFPARAVAYCLREAGITAKELHEFCWANDITPDEFFKQFEKGLVTDAIADVNFVRHSTT